MLINVEQLKPYFRGDKKHAYYTEAVTAFESYRFHVNAELYLRRPVNNVPGLANGKFSSLILERRPNETDEIKAYREKIFVAKTKNPVSKVINSLSKIRRSPDWNVNYDKINWPARIPEDDRLNTYCEKNYPGYSSITNWIFTILLKNYCIDPNCVVAVFPKSLQIKENAFFEPVATLFNSDKVIFYEEGADFAILQSSEMSDISSAAGTVAYQTGKVFYVLTATEYLRFDQTSAGEEYAMTQYVQHNFGYIPVFRVPGVFLEQRNNCIIQESRLAPMLADLDEAAREYSDLQATKVQHMYPLLWYFENKNCPTCNGVGKNISEGSTEGCKSCGGSGKIKFSPYSHMALSAAKIGEQNVPSPPAGYVNRDVEIIRHQEESVGKHIFDALSALNMQFLDQTPLTISGDAKNVDREELQNFVYSVAEDLVNAMDKIYLITNDWRYSYAIPDRKARMAMLPTIPVPQNFDLLPSDYLIDNLGKARTNKVSPVLMGAMETEFAIKTFYNDPSISNMVSLCYNLDPLPGLSEDEKMVRLNNKGVTPVDYVISSNIVAFIKRAMIADSKFPTQKYEDQMAILQKYAEAKQKELSAVAKVLQAVQPEEQAAAAG